MAKQRAFTLVELLVILAIIALLLSILAPTIQRSYVLGERVTCFSNVGKLGQAWFCFTNDNLGIMPGGYTGSGNWIGKYENSRVAVEVGQLYPYIKTVGVYRCPSDTSNHWWTYSISGPMNGEERSWGSHKDGQGKPKYLYTKFMELDDPTMSLVFMEEDDYRSGGNMNSWLTNPLGDSREDQWIDYVVAWHDAGANLAMADGHAEHWQWADEKTCTYRAFYRNDPDGPDLRRLQKVYWPRSATRRNP
ncbi:MAG: hypothetical protein AMJ81_12760 [Phycisphaerae bacterium SM23_33]|nr:MAG: hypothetical protein AMJ81_12760 [Phycisphaerae bacterium SM23_33]